MDDNCCGIILDDPITSLDLEWKGKIASILVEEARQRQVIVFTHDLTFIYHLNKYAEGQKLDMQNHWVKRGDEDDKPGYVFINNSPAVEKEYRKATKAEEIYKLAKDADPSRQEIYIKSGFGALRTSYEAFIIFDLLNNVVQRFEERISPGRLLEIIWDVDLVQNVNERYETISRYIEGHLHSDQYAGSKPSLTLLRNEIDAFNSFKGKLKSLKDLAAKSKKSQKP